MTSYYIHIHIYTYTRHNRCVVWVNQGESRLLHEEILGTIWAVGAAVDGRPAECAIHYLPKSTQIIVIIVGCWSNIVEIIFRLRRFIAWMSSRQA